MNALPPLALYIHIPWCIKKCLYCDFNAHSVQGDLPENEYLEQLKRDLEQELNDVKNRPLRSIFFGGGTPSILSAHFYQQLMDHLRTYLIINEHTEITLEANPGASDQAKFEGFLAAGINRLSIGVQSFNDTHLQALGRQHDSARAVSTLQAAKQAGFSNINLDIMHALPQQTPEQALDDLHRAVDMGTTHISWYELTIERNTVFFSYPPRQPDPDLWADLEQQGFEYLAQAGFPRYEISAYAKQPFHSQHNLNYWEFADYLAIGAGAHGKITTPQGELIRYQKTRLPKHYLAEGGHLRRQTTPIAVEGRPFEFMLNALRLIDGTSTQLFTERTLLPLESIAAPWQQLKEQKLMVDSEHQLACTPKGIQFLNHVINTFG